MCVCVCVCSEQIRISNRFKMLNESKSAQILASRSFSCCIDCIL